MKTGGWLSDRRGWLFAGVMIVVMVTTGWAGTHLEMGGFEQGVLGTLFSLALGLLAGYLFVDKFADHLAERQWATTRRHTLQGLAQHICSMGLAMTETRGRLTVELPSGTFGALVYGQLLPTSTTQAALKSVATLTVQKSVTDADEEQHYCAAKSYHDAIGWRLVEVRQVLTPRIMQCSRSQPLIDALVSWEGTVQQLRFCFSGSELVPHWEAVQVVGAFLWDCQDLYGVLAGEWRKCLSTSRRELADRLDEVGADQTIADLLRQLGPDGAQKYGLTQQDVAAIEANAMKRREKHE